MEITKSKVLRTSLPILFLIVAFTILWPTPTAENHILPEPVVTTVAPVKEVKLKATPLQPIPATEDILKKIAWCESHNRQFNADGSIHRGEINPQDTGKYQINEHYHLEASIALGMDIYTLAGNTAYANYLLKTQGTTPWNWSRKCWADPARVWVERDGELWSK